MKLIKRHSRSTEFAERAKLFSEEYTKDLSEQLIVCGAYAMGADFGYSLAEQELKAKEEEIERLKNRIESLEDLQRISNTLFRAIDPKHPF